MSGCTSLAMAYNFAKTLVSKTSESSVLKNTMPSHPTITQTMKKIDPGDFEIILGHIVTTNTNIDFKQIAIDGKSIRNPSSSAERLLHLISAFVPEVNSMLSQAKPDLGGGEIGTAENILKNLAIKMHTSIALAIQKITEKLDLAFSLITRRINGPD